jgi:hypothetical protein
MNMPVPKKSLISNRVAVKKALIASQPAETEGNPLKVNSLTAQSMKKKRVMMSFKTLKAKI